MEMATLYDFPDEVVWHLVHAEAARRLGVDGYGLSSDLTETLVDFRADVTALRAELGNRAVVTLVRLAPDWHGTRRELVDTARLLTVPTRGGGS